MLFYFVVKYREHEKIKTTARLLFYHYQDDCIYFECFELTRKLLLTCVVSFVGLPGSSTQVLFLLVINTIALLIIAFTRPYVDDSDDILSLSLVSTECIIFLVALISVAGIDQTDNYDSGAMFLTVLIIALFTLCAILPATLSMKLSFFKNKFSAFLKQIDNFLDKRGIRVPSMGAKARYEAEIAEIVRSSYSVSPGSEYYSQSREVGNPITHVEMAKF